MQSPWVQQVTALGRPCEPPLMEAEIKHIIPCLGFRVLVTILCHGILYFVIYNMVRFLKVMVALGSWYLGIHGGLHVEKWQHLLRHRA